MLNIIRNWVIKTMMKSKGETGIVKTIPKRDLVELNTQITAQRLMENGIDPNSLKNTDQVENAIIAIENRNQTMSIGEARGSGIRSTPEAKIMDMEGNEIPKGSKIMGGKEVENTTGSLMSVPNKKGLAGMEYETDAAIKTRLEKGNKETTQRIKNRKMVKDAIDNASPGFVRGDRKYNAQLVAEDLAEKKFGKEYYDLDQTQQLDLYDEALEGYDELTRGMPDPEDFAQGGRAGFKSGEIVKKNIPEEYRLYLKSILPGGEEGKVDESYFTEKFKKELRSQALDKFLRTGKTRGIVTEGDQHRGDPTINKLIKFPSTYAALGTYTYDIDPKTMDVKITDKYDFNPAYGSKTIGGKTYTGYVGDKEGTDVGLGMFKDKFKESIRDKSVDTANVLEMIGNYFGGKQSEGKGFDVDIDIPMEEATTATEGSFADGGRAGFKSGSFLFEGAKKLGKKYKGSTLESLLENPKLLGTELSYEGIMEMLRMSGMMQDGGRAGFFLGSANPKGLGLLRQVLNYMSKTGKEQGKFKGADLSGLDMLRLSNPKAFNKVLEDVRGKVNIREGIMGTDTVRAQQQALREQRKGLTEKSLDVAKAMKRDEDRIAKKIAEESERTIIPRTKIMMMEGMGMSEEAAEKAARDMAEAAQNMRPLNAPPKITDEGILQLENVLKNMETGGKKKRDLNATGGRIGFKDGPKKSMTRRTFLKLLGGLATIPIIGKIVKPIKLAKGVKNVPIIKTDNVAGKPEWFDALVNKVIIEGDDVTKKFATGERQSIHQKTLDDGSVVRVTEDVDDGAVRVEYDSDANVYGDPVQMQYKKPLPDEGAPNPAAEFNTAESGPVGRADGPDDYSIDIDEVGGTSISDLTSDVSKLKEYATGKKPTMKEFIQNKKRKDRAKGISEGGENEMDEVIRRQGEFIEADLVDLDSPEFASGGIARMLGE